MFKSLFWSDKAPFILSLTLSFFGWLLTTAVTNVSNVVILGISVTKNADTTVIYVKNHSPNKSLVNGVINFTCGNSECLDSPFAKLFEVAPYAIKSTKLCSANGRNIVALLNLPPTAQVRFDANVKSNQTVQMMFSGLLPEGSADCPTSDSALKVDNLWVIQGASLTLYLLDYYFDFLCVSILITFIFLIAILLRSGSQPMAANDETAKH